MSHASQGQDDADEVHLDKILQRDGVLREIGSLYIIDEKSREGVRGLIGVLRYKMAHDHLGPQEHSRPQEPPNERTFRIGHWE